MKKPKSITETIERVQELLTEDRWIKNAYVRGRGSNAKYCLIGAVEKVDGEFEGDVKELMAECLPSSYHGEVMSFNDDEHTTYRNVVSFLKRCLKAAKKLDKEQAKLNKWDEGHA